MTTHTALPAWVESLHRKHGAVLTLCSAVLLGVWLFYFATNVHSAVDPESADSTADLLVATSLSVGSSPYEDLRTLSEVTGIAYTTAIGSESDEVFTHPRTPAALLLLMPLLPLEPNAALWFAHALTLGTIAAFGVWLIPRLTHLPLWSSMFAAALLLFSGPVVRALQFGSVGPMIALLCGMTWLFARERDSWWSGVPLGIAAAVRLFPLLLVVPLLLYGRRRSAFSAAVLAIGLNIAGLLGLRIDLMDVVDGLSTTNSTWATWPANGSLVRFLSPSMGVLPAVVGVSVLVVAGAVLIWRAGHGFTKAFSFTAVGMLLASPLAWEHYDVIVLLAAVVLLVLGGRIERWFSLVVLAFGTIGYHLRQPFESLGSITAGDAALTMRTIFLLGLLLFVFTSLVRTDGPTTLATDSPDAQ